MKVMTCAKDSAAKVVNRVHPFLVRRTGGRIGGSLRSAPVVLLTTTGRKSGKARTVPLIFLRDGADVVIVASYGGDDRSPAWFHNLLADPRVSIEIDGKRQEMVASVADPATKARLWPQLVQMYSGYAGYQKRTEREIPVVLLRGR